MELQSLKLIVTDTDANQLLREFAPKDLEIGKPAIHFTAEGVRVTGETTALLFKVSFETLWTVALADGCVVARLNSLKVAGIPAGKLRGVLLKVLRDALPKEPGIRVEDEVVRVDLNEVLRKREVPLLVRLTAVRCVEGSIVIEAG